MMEKLYNALYSKGYYTKSFDEFKTQFGDKEGANKLYSALNSKGYYTKSFDEFKTQFKFNFDITPKNEVLSEVKTQQTSTEQPSTTQPSFEDQYAAMSEEMMKQSTPQQAKTEPQDAGATVEEGVAPGPISPRMKQRQRELDMASKSEDGSSGLEEPKPEDVEAEYIKKYGTKYISESGKRYHFPENKGKEGEFVWDVRNLDEGETVETPIGTLTKINYKDFAASIKEKDPSQRDRLDITVAEDYIEKYPIYKNQVSFEGAEKYTSKDAEESIPEGKKYETFLYSRGVDVPVSIKQYQQLSKEKDFDLNFGDYFRIENPNTGEKYVSSVKQITEVAEQNGMDPKEYLMTFIKNPSWSVKKIASDQEVFGTYLDEVVLEAKLPEGYKKISKEANSFIKNELSEIDSELISLQKQYNEAIEDSVSEDGRKRKEDIEKRIVDLRTRKQEKLGVFLIDYSEDEQEVIKNLTTVPSTSIDEINNLAVKIDIVKSNATRFSDFEKKNGEKIKQIGDKIKEFERKINSGISDVEKLSLIEEYEKFISQNTSLIDEYNQIYASAQFLNDELNSEISNLNNLINKAKRENLLDEDIKQAADKVYSNWVILGQELEKVPVDIMFAPFFSDEMALSEAKYREKQSNNRFELDPDFARENGLMPYYIGRKIVEQAPSTAISLAGLLLGPEALILSAGYASLSSAVNTKGQALLSNYYINKEINDLQNKITSISEGDGEYNNEGDKALAINILNEKIATLKSNLATDSEITQAAFSSGAIEGILTYGFGKAITAAKVPKLGNKLVNRIFGDSKIGKMILDPGRGTLLKKGSAALVGEYAEESSIAGLDAGITQNWILHQDLGLGDVYTEDFMWSIGVNSLAMSGGFGSLSLMNKFASTKARDNARNELINSLLSIKQKYDLAEESGKQDLFNEFAGVASLLDIQNQNNVASMLALPDSELKRVLELNKKRQAIQNQRAAVEQEFIEGSKGKKGYDEKYALMRGVQGVLSDLDNKYNKLDSELEDIFKRNFGKDEDAKAPQKEDATPTQRYLANSYMASLGIAKQKAASLVIDSSFSEEVKIANKKGATFTEENKRSFIEKVKNSEQFSSLDESVQSEILSYLEGSNKETIQKILEGNGTFQNGFAIFNEYKAKAVIYDEKTSMLDKFSAAQSAKHEIQHAFISNTDAIGNLNEEQLGDATDELIEFIKSKKEQINKRRAGMHDDILNRIKKYNERIDENSSLSDIQKAKQRYEELMILYNELRNADIIGDSFFAASHNLQDLVRSLHKITFGYLFNAGNSINNGFNVAEHVRTFDKFYRGQKDIRYKNKEEGQAFSLSFDDALESLEDKLYSGEIDYDQYESARESLINKKRSENKKESFNPKKFKETLDDVGNSPGGFDFFDPRIEPTIKSMVKAYARRFRTKDNNVSDLTTLPGFDIEDFASEVYFNMMTGKKMQDGGYGPGYIQKFDPKKNDSFYGYVNAQIKNRMNAVLQKGDMTQESFSSEINEQTLSYTEESAFDEFDSEQYTEDDIELGLINPIHLVDVDLQNEASTEMQGKIKNLQFDLLTFKNIPNLATETLAKFFKTRESVIAKPSQNLNTTELEDTAPIIKKIAKQFMSIMPEGAIFPRDGEQIAISEKLIGTSTGLPRKILDAFYEKGKRLVSAQEGAGRKGAGLEPYTLKKGITEEQFLAALGINPDGTHNSDIKPKSPESQTRRAMLDLLGKLMTNTAARQMMLDMGISPININNVKYGASEMMLSESAEGVQFNDNLMNRLSNKKDLIIGPKDLQNLFEVFKMETLGYRNWASVEPKIMETLLRILDEGNLNEGLRVAFEYSPIIKSFFNGKGVSESERRAILEREYDIFVSLRSVPISKKYKDESIVAGTQEMIDSYGIYLADLGLSQAFIRDLFGKGTNVNFDSKNRVELTEKQKKHLDGIKKEIDRLKDKYGEQKGPYPIPITKIRTSSLSRRMNEFGQNTRNEDAKERVEKSQSIVNEYKRYNELRHLIRNYTINAFTENLNKNFNKEGGIAFVMHGLTDTSGGMKDLSEVSKMSSMYSEKTFIEGDKAQDEIERTRSAAAKRLGITSTEARKIVNENKENGVPSSQDLIDASLNNHTYFRIEHFVPTYFYNMTNVSAAFGGRLHNPNFRYKSGITDNSYSIDMDKQSVKMYLEDGTYLDVGYKTGAIYHRYQYMKGRAEADGGVVFSLSPQQLDFEMAEIISQKTGIDVQEQISESTARLNADRRKKRFRFMSPTADDFTGLWYSFLGKGKLGDKQKAFFEKYLSEPLNRAYIAMAAARQKITRDFKDLNKEYEDVKVSLPKKSGYLKYTNDQALRAYLYLKSGASNKTLGISDVDAKALTDIVEGNQRMMEYATYLQELTGTQDEWVSPKSVWTFGSIFDDVERIIDDVKRADYISEWKKNAEAIFSANNMNKIESYYGSDFRKALEDMLYRIENGKAIPEKTTKEMSQFQKWLTGSVAVTMFFNRKSAVLQLMSLTNYINWTDNNPFQAAKAFANIPQFAKDVVRIFNSDYLRERRGGLKTEVEAAVLANELRKGGVEGYRGFINKLLQKGFTFTQIGDSLAISFGGASFYRNRKNSYLRQGMSEQEAHDKAWIDFIEATETSQQSARPDKLSMQQTTTTGRIFLAFQNTPMQYYRIITRSAQDLAAGRGDPKEHLSKIGYYAFLQSAIFSGLQQSLFAFLGEGPEDEDDREKFTDEKRVREIRTINSVLDTMLKGSGVQGVYVATLKNALITYIEENEKGFKADHVYTFLELLNVSAPIGIKARTLYQGAIQNDRFNREIVEEMGFDIDNPAYDVVGSLLSAGVNIPMDKVINDMRELKEAADSENETWQRILLALGWSERNLGMENEDVKEAKAKKTEEKRKANKEKRKKESSGWGGSSKKGWGNSKKSGW